MEERIKLGQEIVGNKTLHSPEYQRDCAISIYKRLKAVVTWTPEFKLKSKVVLFKPKLVSIEVPDDDYGLSRFCENPVDVRLFEGNHVSILENIEVAEAANKYFGAAQGPQENGGKEDLLINIDKIQTDVPTKL